MPQSYDNVFNVRLGWSAEELYSFVQSVDMSLTSVVNDYSLPVRGELVVIDPPEPKVFLKYDQGEIRIDDADYLFRLEDGRLIPMHSEMIQWIQEHMR